MENRRPHAAVADGGISRGLVDSLRRAALRGGAARGVRAAAMVCPRARRFLPVAGTADRRRDRRLHQPGRGDPPAWRRRQQARCLRGRLGFRHHPRRLLVHGTAAVRRPLQARRRPGSRHCLSLLRSGHQYPRHRADSKGAGVRTGGGTGDRRRGVLGHHRPRDGDALSPRRDGTYRFRRRSDGVAGGSLSFLRGQRCHPVRTDDRLPRVRQLGEGGGGRQRALARDLCGEVVAGEHQRCRRRPRLDHRVPLAVVAHRDRRRLGCCIGIRFSAATAVRDRHGCRRAVRHRGERTRRRPGMVRPDLGLRQADPAAVARRCARRWFPAGPARSRRVDPVGVGG